MGEIVMKTINVNRGLKLRTGSWDEAFTYVSGMQFNRQNITDEEADYAIRLCEQGATPMQAAIEMYGQPNGRFVDRTVGRKLLLPSDGSQFDVDELMDKIKRRRLH
jgi:hypothetical protein